MAAPASASAQRTGLCVHRRRGASQASGVAAGQRGLADADDVAADLDARPRQQGLGQAAGGHPRRRLARARALEHVAQVVGQVLQGAREVGVPGPRVLERAARLGLGRLRIGRHHVPPVLVVAVPDDQGDRAAEGHPVADAGEDLDGVGLDLHAAAAAVAALAAAEVGVDGGAVHGDARGQAVHHHGERGAVGLAGVEEAQHLKPRSVA